VTAASSGCTDVTAARYTVDVKQGFVIPGGTATEQLEQAVLAEEAGWDGVFVAELGFGVDAWALLSAIAVRTERVRLGTMLTPLPWRRPWKLAGQVATLDQLSDGRATLAVGVGAVDTGLGTYPEVTDLRERAALLDTYIDVVRSLLDGDVELDDIGLDLREAVAAAPRPVQARVPIWCVAVATPRSMRRVQRCDGLVVQAEEPGQLAAMLQWFDTNGGRPRDVVAQGETEPGGSDVVTSWADAGATWWLESRWSAPEEARDRIASGPVPSVG
jgi:alkanesulfonate monooxygenase SsuD/methylene tetrahydromethanopterin reductase-like flavin-dependent oxidoreductase (luciferase family)